MWHINYISYLSNFCNNLKQAKKAHVEFDDTINKLNAGLTEGPTLNKYKSSDEDIDARKKKGTLSEETHERLGDLQTVGGVVKETAADHCRVPHAAISLVSDSIN